MATELLTANQQDLESGVTTGWAVGSNCTIAAVDAAPNYTGTRSLRMQCTTGSTDMQVTTSTGTSGFAVSANSIYIFTSHIRAAATARNTKMEILWYNSGGTLIATTSSSFGPGEGVSGSPSSIVQVNRARPRMVPDRRASTIVKHGAGGNVGGQPIRTPMEDVDRILWGGHNGWHTLYVAAMIPPDNAAVFAALSIWVQAPAAAEQHFVDASSALFTGNFKGTQLEVENIVGFDATNPIGDVAFIGLRGKDPVDPLMGQGGATDTQGSWGTI